MIYKFVIGFALSFLLATNVSSNLPELGLNLLSSLNPLYPTGLQGVVLLLLRLSVGVLFLLHGYPKITHLRLWANSLKMPLFLCFLSAASMLGGGICLILGFLTLLASVAIVLEIVQGLPFVASDPYLIPEGQYQGPKGKGEPPSWEKAFMYCVMLMAIGVFGPGAYSLDALMWGA